MNQRQKKLPPPPLLLTPAEVARFFHVHPKTVGRWADQGKLSVTYTLGGHRRFLRTEVEELATSQRH